MKVKQLSVLIENKAGRVSEITSLLGGADVNIRGFSVCDTAENGILRLVVDQPGKAADVLEAAGFTVKQNDVICIALTDEPGALANALKVVADAGVNIEYVYSLVSTNVVLNVSDSARALDLLEDEPVRLVSQEEIARM